MACATAVQQFFTDSFCFSEGLLISLLTSALDELLLDELLLDELLLDELLHRSHMRGSRGPRGVSPLLIEAAQPRGARSPTCAIGGDSPEFQISNCLYD